MDGSGARGVTATYRSGEGAEVSCPLAEVDGRLVAEGAPVRLPPSHAGQRHYPGLFWSATNPGHVVYESLLELAWLWLADFDPSVRRIAAQPLSLVGDDGGQRRVRYPDFLVVDGAGDVRVVDVKAAGVLGSDRVRTSLVWTGEVIRDRAWSYEVWTAPDPVRLRNVRLIGAARRRSVVSDHASTAAAAELMGPVPFAALERAVGRVDGLGCPPRLAILGALWHGHLTCDLSVPLTESSLVEVA